MTLWEQVELGRSDGTHTLVWIDVDRHVREGQRVRAKGDAWWTVLLVYRGIRVPGEMLHRDWRVGGLL